MLCYRYYFIFYFFFSLSTPNQLEEIVTRRARSARNRATATPTGRITCSSILRTGRGGLGVGRYGGLQLLKPIEVPPQTLAAVQSVGPELAAVHHVVVVIKHIYMYIFFLFFIRSRSALIYADNDRKTTFVVGTYFVYEMRVFWARYGRNLLMEHNVVFRNARRGSTPGTCLHNIGDRKEFPTSIC